MSDEAEEIVRRIVDATNRADVGAFVAALSPDVEWEDTLFWTEGGTVHRGPAAVREWLNQVWEPWDDLQMEVVEVKSAPDGSQFVGFDLAARQGERSRNASPLLVGVANRGRQDQRAQRVSRPSRSP